MDAIITAIIAGLISGFMSPLILSVLKHKLVWRAQKRDEIKMNAFHDTLKALASIESDALDAELQSSQKEYKGGRFPIKIRSETIIAMGKALGVVDVFFSTETFKKVHKATCIPISIENIPNIEFEISRKEAIASMANELGINIGLWDVIIRRFSLIFKKN